MEPITWWRTRNNIVEKQRNSEKQKPNNIARMNLLLYRGQEGDIRFKTKINGEFKIDEDSITIAAIQEMIKKLEEESKTNKWSVIFNHPEKKP